MNRENKKNNLTGNYLCNKLYFYLTKHRGNDLKQAIELIYNFLLAETIKYCKQRKIFGKPLINDWLKKKHEI
jgi:hypothetical protein